MLTTTDIASERQLDVNVIRRAFRSAELEAVWDGKALELRPAVFANWVAACRIPPQDPFRRRLSS